MNIQSPAANSDFASGWLIPLEGQAVLRWTVFRIIELRFFVSSTVLKNLPERQAAKR